MFWWVRDFFYTFAGDIIRRVSVIGSRGADIGYRLWAIGEG